MRVILTVIVIINYDFI